MQNDASHSMKAQLLLLHLPSDIQTVKVKLSFLQAFGFSKGARMHWFTCHKYVDTFPLLSDRNPGKSHFKASLLLHWRTPLKACQIALHECVWRWSLNCWDLSEGCGKSYTLATSSAQIFHLLTLVFSLSPVTAGKVSFCCSKVLEDLSNI